jgi:phosphatidylserine/phosphatidylglycerophosphate/cardiolipin synthase-like enzyme
MSGTDPTDWFLTQAETRLQPTHTSQNTVTALADGEAYFARLRTALQAIGAGGYVHVSGWRLTPQVRLLGDVPNSPSIAELITDCANAGAKIRALLWYVPGTIGDFGASHGAENLDMAQLVEDLGGEVALDDRLPIGSFASHHQKFFVLGDGATDVAFIGGIDIALDRWDRPEHDEPAGRQRELFDAWHDVQALVEGPAVGQLWESFAERWNDPREPNGAPFTAGNSSPTPIPAGDKPSPAGTGTCHVQVLRTYACESRDPSPFANNEVFPFAPNGDRTYEAALIRAIDAAEHFVYIEDQYLWPCRVVDALADAVGRGVSVILVLTNNYDVPGLVPYHNFLRQSCLDQIRAADPTRVFVFHLAQDGSGNDDIYVHAKTLVIDDRYAVIGSANVNSRSMTTDTEIAVAIVDSDVRDGTIGGQALRICTFARDYRKQLWLEHLGSQNDDPLNVDGSPRGWPTNADQAIHHVHVHQVPEPRFCRPSFLPFVFMNPETTCP